LALLTLLDLKKIGNLPWPSIAKPMTVTYGLALTNILKLDVASIVVAGCGGGGGGR
jgi:hypothetical protein